MSRDTQLSWIREINAAFPFHAFADFHETDLLELVAQHGCARIGVLSCVFGTGYSRRSDN
jgi:hypothetical protein